MTRPRISGSRSVSPFLRAFSARCGEFSGLRARHGFTPIRSGPLVYPEGFARRGTGYAHQQQLPSFRSKRGNGGYALLLVLFMLALITIAVTAVAPSVITQGKREKEEEMIWRGKQYVRGIKLFYRKNGRFPKEIDDLTKPKQGSLRFMRQAYKDPMNKEDGSWRLIYVGPSGQLIGSLKPRSAINFPAGPQVGTPASAIAAQNPNQAGAQPFGAPAGASTFGAAPATGGISTAPGASGQPGVPPGVATAQPGQGTDASNGTAPGNTDDQAQASAAAADTPTILGGNIIGVGSKINRRSLRIYEKAKNYRLFEFIWDPSKDVAAAIAQPQQGTGAGAPTNGPGTQPTGAQPGTGTPQPPQLPPTQINPPNN